jgi:hypothetical protein
MNPTFLEHASGCNNTEQITSKWWFNNKNSRKITRRTISSNWLIRSGSGITLECPALLPPLAFRLALSCLFFKILELEGFPSSGTYHNEIQSEKTAP